MAAKPSKRWTVIGGLAPVMAGAVLIAGVYLCAVLLKPADQALADFAAEITILTPSGHYEVTRILEAEAGYLLVKSPTDDASLLCYKTETNKLMWSASLGETEWEPKGGRFPPEPLMTQIVPIAASVSRKAEMVNVISEEPWKLYALRLADGSIADECEINRPLNVFSTILDGLPVVEVVTVDSIKLYDQFDFSRELLDVAVPGVYRLPGTKVGKPILNLAGDTVYCVLEKRDTVVSCSFSLQEGVPMYTVNNATTDSKPFECVLVGTDYLAVGCSYSATVNIFDAASLQRIAAYPGLDNMSDIESVAGMVVVSSSYIPLPRSKKHGSAIKVINPATGTSEVEYLDKKYPLKLSGSPITGSFIVFDQGTMESRSVPDGQYMSEVRSLMNGRMWAYQVQPLTLVGNQPLANGFVESACCPVTQRLYVLSDGPGIAVYVFY